MIFYHKHDGISGNPPSHHCYRVRVGSDHFIVAGMEVLSFAERGLI